MFEKTDIEMSTGAVRKRKKTRWARSTSSTERSTPSWRSPATEELLDEEVTALAGERDARKAPSVGGRRHGSNPGSWPASACRFACPGFAM